MYCGYLDNGGVHYNSGPPNHAFALMVDGGSYNGYTVNPIGLDKAVQIHYRALTVKLGQSSSFVDHYNAVRLHSAIGYVAPKDMLEGRAKIIHEQRDRKLEQARERRRLKRLEATGPDFLNPSAYGPADCLIPSMQNSI